MGKRHLALVACLAAALALPCGARAASGADPGFTRIDDGEDGRAAAVYENAGTGEKYAVYEPGQFAEGADILLYRDPRTGEEVSIEILERASGSPQKSGGEAGEGAVMLKVRLCWQEGEASFDVDLTPAPAEHLAAYNAACTLWGWTLTDSELSMQGDPAGAAPVRACYEFDAVLRQLGMELGTQHCYLASEITEEGHRIAWRVAKQMNGPAIWKMGLTLAALAAGGAATVWLIKRRKGKA